MKAFIDTKMLPDVLAKREPFNSDSARVWTLADRGRIEAQASVISFNNISCIVPKSTSRRIAERSLRLLRNVFTPPLDIQILNRAIHSDFRDFEGVIQFHSAIRSEADCLITRDTCHCPKSGLSVLAPAGFLAAKG